MKMKTERLLWLAPLVAVPAATALVLSIAALFVDHIEAQARAAGDKRRIEALEAAAIEDFERVAELDAERERQTEASIRRQSWQSDVTAILVVSAVAFLLSAKWGLSGRSPAAERDRITAMFAALAREASPEPSRDDRRRATSRPRAAAPRDFDLAFIDALLEREGRSKEAAIPILQAIQAHYRYLPDEALARVCERTQITPAQIAGVSTFYAQFRRSPVGRHVVKVCLGTACHVLRSREIVEELRRHLGMAAGRDTDPERIFTIDEVACLGCCSLAPVMMVDGETFGPLQPASACEALRPFRENGAS